MLQIPAQAVRDAYAADAELAPVLLAIAGPESTWRANPEPPGDDGSSFGYTQLHVGGISVLYPGAGLGDGHPIEQLRDGVTNFRIAAAAIRARLARNGGDMYDALQPWSTRDEAWALLQQIKTESIVGGAAQPVVTGGAGALVVLGLLTLFFVARG